MGEWHSGKLTWRKPELVAETLVYGNLTKACVCCSSCFFSTKRSSGTWFNLRLGGFLWDFFLEEKHLEMMKGSVGKSPFLSWICWLVKYDNSSM